MADCARAVSQSDASSSPGVASDPSRLVSPSLPGSSKSLISAAPASSCTEQHGAHSGAVPWHLRLCAGWLAGALSEILYGHPLSTVQAHMENAVAHALLRPSLRGLFLPQSTSNVGHVARLSETARLLVRRDGFQGLYRGAAVPVIAGSLAGAAAFTTYGHMRRLLRDDHGFGPRSSAALAGAASGLAASVAMAPLEIVTIRLQLALPADIPIARDANWSERLAVRLHRFVGGLPILPIETVVERQGWQALWSAIRPTAAREIVFYAGYYVTYEEVHKRLRTFGTPDFLAILAGGGAAGATGTLCSHQLNSYIAHQHDQLEKVLRGERQDLSTPSRGAYGKLSVRSFLHGVWPALIRAVPLNAICFLVYETVVHAGHR